LRFERHLSLLRDAAARGEGIPKFVNNTAEEHEEEQYEYHHEIEPRLEEETSTAHLGPTGAEDHAQYQEDYQEHREAATGDATYEDEDDQAAETHDGTTAVEDNQVHTTKGEYQTDDAAEADLQDGDTYDEAHDEAQHADGLEGEYEEYRQPGNDDEHIDDAAQAVEATDPAEIAHDADAYDDHAEEDHADEATVESGASSTTLRADQVVDTTGKYKDEEFIDWDDELSLTPSTSEPGRDGEFDELNYLDDPEYATETHHDLTADADETGLAEHNTENGYEYDDTYADALREVVEDGVDKDDVDAHNSTINAEMQAYSEARELTNGAAPEATNVDDTYEGFDDEQNEDDPDRLDDDAEVFDGPNEDAADDNTALHAQEDNIVQPTTPHASSPAGLEDDIDFDDDTEAQHAAKTAANGSGASSPLGQRSFDEYENLYDDEGEPTPKKARAS
ncbi:hypothetical protein LTR95_016128, partial [Oleoguttula sp. CCFEE 5521]